jgi:hypothetical protein
MTRVQEYFRLLENRTRHAITPGRPEDDAMLALMVYVAFSDGVIDDSEIRFLQRVLPGRNADALRDWVQQVVAHPLDVAAVAEALPSADSRWKGLRFAARMAWKDGNVAPQERQLLNELAEAMNLPNGAVQRVIREMTVLRNDRVRKDHLTEVLHSIGWGAVQFAEGPLCSPDLIGNVPSTATDVIRVGVDTVEVMAFYEEGFVARFREGPAFLYWTDIVAWTHGSGLGEPVQLHTEDGRIWTLVDRRVNGICTVLDRLLNVEDNDEEDTVALFTEDLEEL